MDRPSDDGEEEDKGAVTVSTIHSAKGLEWRRVYLTNCVEGSLPHRFSSGSPQEIEEERRLLYVACTRSRDSLAICIHNMEQRGPNTLVVQPSRFLREVGITI
jgi:DNA helicase-2/ATP-dependent DNA helicase PcrA